MRFYLRKSISVGALRFNLSKSGVGVSAGVRGFRVGSGPRGNYVNIGQGGIYYRATLPPATRNAPSGPRSVKQARVPVGTHEPLREIESADVSQIIDSSSEELLSELNEKRRRGLIWPFVVVASAIALGLGVLLSWPVWILALITIAATVCVYLVYQRDLLAKTTVLFYELDGDMESAYGLLHSWAEQLAGCQRAWHIAAEGRVYDTKYHAGASSLVQRSTTSISKTDPPNLKSNVETVAIGVGRQTLYFFPDRVLIYDTNGVGAVAYSNLALTARESHFIETGSVPSDAKVVDHTWEYVNKKGGPDRRFKNNRELPICLYDELALASPTGLNEVIQVSRCGVADGFARAIEHLAAKLPDETTGTQHAATD